MAVEIVTKEDLEAFRKELLSDFTAIIEKYVKKDDGAVEGYKTGHVRKILGCSFNKLVALRISRKIRTKKIGGTIYYNKDDIKRLLEEGF